MMPKVGVPPTEIPKEFVKRCEKGELGGVMLVFLNGKNTTEIQQKVRDVQKFAKRLQKKYPAPTGVYESKKKT